MSLAPPSCETLFFSSIAKRRLLKALGWKVGTIDYHSWIDATATEVDPRVMLKAAMMKYRSVGYCINDVFLLKDGFRKYCDFCTVILCRIRTEARQNERPIDPNLMAGSEPIFCLWLWGKSDKNKRK